MAVHDSSVMFNSLVDEMQYECNYPGYPAMPIDGIHLGKAALGQIAQIWFAMVSVKAKKLMFAHGPEDSVIVIFIGTQEFPSRGVTIPFISEIRYFFTPQIKIWRHTQTIDSYISKAIVDGKFTPTHGSEYEYPLGNDEPTSSQTDEENVAFITALYSSDSTTEFVSAFAPNAVVECDFPGTNTLPFQGRYVGHGQIAAYKAAGVSNGFTLTTKANFVVPGDRNTVLVDVQSTLSYKDHAHALNPYHRFHMITMQDKKITALIEVTDAASAVAYVQGIFPQQSV